MDPPDTRLPPNRFTPRRWELLSGRSASCPVLFVCHGGATCLDLDTRDAHQREVGAEPVGAALLLAALALEHPDLGAARVVLDHRPAPWRRGRKGASEDVAVFETSRTWSKVTSLPVSPASGPR